MPAGESNTALQSGLLNSLQHIGQFIFQYLPERRILRVHDRQKCMVFHSIHGVPPIRVFGRLGYRDQLVVCFHTGRTQLVPKVSAYAKVGFVSVSAAKKEFRGKVGAGANLHCGPNMR